MNDEQKIELLRNCFEDTIWMAIRYADGRFTYAPSMVRDAVKNFQKVFPEWKPRHDITLSPPKDDNENAVRFADCYLHDLVKQ